MADEARASASTAADEIARGDYRGPLHGIPVALKDLFDVAGVPTTAASKILADNVAATDSAATKRLREAGAVLLGKLNLHQFAFGATGRSSDYGPACNPWDVSRVTGGSSSGSGAAVASGECMAALGTDTGGSIRIPASLCGVTGLKPTFGRVSRAGLLPLSWSLDHAGPLTRTVEDTAIVLQALAGRDVNDGWSSAEPVPDYREHIRDGVKGLRIGVPDSFFSDQLLPETDEAVRQALGVLEGLGASVEPVTLPYIADIPNGVTAIMLPEALSYHRKWMAERPEDYADDVRYRLELGAAFTALDYVDAQRFREMAVRAWRDEVFSRFDVIATAATQTTATPIEASDLSVVFSLIRLTNPLNLLGIPAISVPCGFSPEGLPIGLQLAGRWWDEATVLRTAYAYEQATGWHTRRPPL
jgi:aspartyl-tRNA(Asn)/glutamyl-tRNA(Gln) amidotransferase subunit A